MAVEYAGILAAVSLMAIALTGAYGRNVAAVFDTSSVGVTAVVKAAKAQKVPVAGAKSAYMRAPYKKPALRFLYGLGWIGGTKNLAQCGLTSLGPGAAKDAAVQDMRKNPKLVAQLKRRGISVSAAANAVTNGVVSACA